MDSPGKRGHARAPPAMSPRPPNPLPHPLLLALLSLAPLAVDPARGQAPDPAATPAIHRAALPEVEPATITPDRVIPQTVARWAAPEPPDWSPLPGMDLPVTAANPGAAAQVIAGIESLHLFWDQQALRHFARALQLDPDCPLAWWGVAMSLLPQNNEFVEQRNLALRKLPTLRAAGQPWERELIDMLLVYPVQGVPGAVNELDQLLELRPDDLNARLLKANFLRGGHALDGSPEPNLNRAQQIVALLVREFPDHPLVIHYALRVTFPAPLPRQELARLAANLAEGPLLSPYCYYEVAQVRFLEGDYEKVRQRCAAGIALAREWIEESGADAIDCPLLFRLVELDVAAALELGEIASARARAESLAATPIPPGRERSEAAGLLQFRSMLLPARVPMRFGRWQEALELVPPASDTPLDPADLAPWSWQALRFYLQGRIAAEAGDAGQARVAHGRLAELGARYQEMAPEAIAAGQRLSWHGEQRLFEQYSLLLQAQIAHAEGNDERAYLWLRTAIGALARIDPEAPPLTAPGPCEELGRLALAEADPELGRRAYNQSLSTVAPDQAFGWLGLARAFQQQGDSRRAVAALGRFERAWERADAREPLLQPALAEAEAIRREAAPPATAGP